MTKKEQSNAVKEQVISYVLLALLVGLGGGYGLAQLAHDHGDEGEHNSYSSHSEEEDDGHNHGGSHEKGLFEVPADQAPTVDFDVQEDAMHGGYTIKINTTNFTFTPENVNQADVIGEGHAHLYVGDKKVARVYSEYFHYDGHFEGTEAFRVTLNSNMHNEYAVDGEVIEAIQDVTHDESMHEDMKMDDDMNMESEETMDMDMNLN